MRIFLVISMSCLLAGGAMAQRGGGGHGGGGFGGGGFGGGGSHGGGMGGGGFRGGGFGGGGFTGGGFHGGFGGFNGGFRGGFDGFRGGFREGFGFNRGWGGWGFGGGWGLGVGYWPGYFWDSGYPYDYYAPYGGSYYPAYPTYPSSYGYSPATTVVYPPQQSNTVYMEPPVHPSMHVYDEYGQEVGNAGAARTSSSPLYLVALQDHTIHAAISYRVDGSSLTYVDQQHEEKTVPLSSIDRSLTMQLNRERHVPMNLPQ